MPSSQTGFDQYGRQLSTDELAQTSAGIMTSRVLGNIRQANGRLISKIEVGVVTNPSFNAVATSHSNNERIALFIGIPETLLTIIPSWLARADTWLSVGDPTVEDGGPLPNDQTRSHFAVQAATGALYFVVAHEFGHILRGHLSFLISRFHQDILPELGYGRSDRIPSSMLRAMEIDADTMAAVNFTDNILLNIRNQSRLSPVDFLRAKFFGLGVLFALLSQADGSGRAATELTHPRAYIRYFLAAERIRTSLAEALRTIFVASVDPDGDSYKELSRLFPSLWTSSVSEGLEIHTGEFQELIVTCQKLEPDFVAFANARLARDGLPPTIT